ERVSANMEIVPANRHDRVDAIVLAGGALETERFPGIDAGVRRKAQLSLLGRPMVERVAQALRSCSQSGRIVIVGPESLASAERRALGVGVTPEAGSITENLRAGLDALPGGRRIFALSGDLPLLCPAALHDLLARAPEADIVFPYVE